VASKAQEIEGLMAAFMGIQPEPMEVKSEWSQHLRLAA
jgi:hypothetical protein